MDRRAAQLNLYSKMIDDKKILKSNQEQGKVNQDNKMQSEWNNMTDIINSFVQEEGVIREELITSKMPDLRKKIKMEIKRKIKTKNPKETMESNKEKVEA